MTLREKQKALLTALADIKDPQQQLAHLVERGRRAGSLPPESRSEDFRVPGCLAKLWLVAECRDGRCFFKCDSDSAIVKGVAALLCEFYSGHVPGEILTIEPSFLSQAGVTQHLTANRRNVLSRVWETIAGFARSCCTEPASSNSPRQT